MPIIASIFDCITSVNMEVLDILNSEQTKVAKRSFKADANQAVFDMGGMFMQSFEKDFEMIFDKVCEIDDRLHRCEKDIDKICTNLGIEPSKWIYEDEEPKIIHKPRGAAANNQYKWDQLERHETHSTMHIDASNYIVNNVDIDVENLVRSKHKSTVTFTCKHCKKPANFYGKVDRLDKHLAHCKEYIAYRMNKPK